MNCFNGVISNQTSSPRGIHEHKKTSRSLCGIDHRHYDGPNSTTWGHLIIAGCWEGTADQLDHRIHDEGEHGWDRDDIDLWRTDYEGVIALARARTAEWAAEPLTSSDHERWEQVTA